jgi:hypothetical protein
MNLTFKKKKKTIEDIKNLKKNKGKYLYFFFHLIKKK